MSKSNFKTYALFAVVAALGGVSALIGCGTNSNSSVNCPAGEIASGSTCVLSAAVSGGTCGIGSIYINGGCYSQSGCPIGEGMTPSGCEVGTISTGVGGINGSCQIPGMVYSPQFGCCPYTNGEMLISQCQPGSISTGIGVGYGTANGTGCGVGTVPVILNGQFSCVPAVGYNGGGYYGSYSGYGSYNGYGGYGGYGGRGY